MCPQDLFGDQAGSYARHRPTYPERLFHQLAALAPSRQVAWDCGTGSGQSARSLARHFGAVVATDSSRRQLAHAPSTERVGWVLAAAEQAPLRPASVDLVTVATALHWFDRPRFYAEVRRVARPGAVLAVWSYYQCLVEPAIDAVLARFADEVVGDWWGSGIELNRRGYRDLDFPFTRLPWPVVEAEARMRLEDLFAYMRTWSSSQAWARAHGSDPVAVVRDDLTRAWGAPSTERRVHWPLHGAIGKIRD
jgi:ubiquinone/menaquinone biosynthesis C-methylase UbiE